MGAMAHTIRRHTETSDFTITPRSTAQDSRLSPVASCVLWHILAFAPGWVLDLEVVRTQRNIGRDQMQGAMANLREAGYAKLDVIRGKSGQIMGSEYTISSRPEFVNEDRGPENPVSGSESLKNRPPEKPAAGKPGSNRKNKDIIEIDSPLNPPTPPSGDVPEEVPFEEFERAFGFNATTPLEPARKTFAALNPSDRRAAIRAAPAYSAECRQRKQTRAKPHTWLRQRGWEAIEKFSSSSLAKPKSNQVWLEKGSPEFEAWDQHSRRTTGNRLPSIFSAEHNAEGWYKPTKSPPMQLPPAAPRYVDRTHHG